jgi:hypothetical protein
MADSALRLEGWVAYQEPSALAPLRGNTPTEFSAGQGAVESAPCVDSGAESR